MSFAQDNGYVPITFDVLMGQIRVAINAQFGTSFTAENFVGTNWYKYFYSLVQRVLENETKTAEIFLKLSKYIESTNLKIQRPSVSLPGLLDSFTSQGYVASVKPPIQADAGTISIAVNVDSTAPTYAATKLAVATLIKEYVAGGIVSLGTQTQAITLSNGQQFDFKFFLPNKKPVKLKLTATLSDNQLLSVPSDIVIREKIFDQINARYRLGWDFEPQRYFTPEDAPWAATLSLQYSFDAGVTWLSVVYEANFDDLFTFALSDITVVIIP